MKQRIAFMIAATVCGSIFIPIVVSMFYVGKVSDVFRDKMLDLLLFLAGGVVNWLMKSDEPPKV